jgi:AbrB family looped-hinge helix DNA binding protein
MSILTVSAKGQVTLRKDVLEHLGVHPGEKITVNKLPDGKIELRVGRKAMTIGCSLEDDPHTTTTASPAPPVRSRRPSA